MRKFKRSLVAAAVALAVSAPAAAQFTNGYAFGDSLFDAGQYGARFTTNPGLVAPMYVGLNFGFALTPSFTGGNDYAQGGALVNTPQGDLPPGVPDLSVAAQVNQFLAKGPIDRNALYQIDGGGNDIVKQFTLFATGQISQAQMQAAVSQAAADLAVQVGKLKAAGAQYVIVQMAPNVGKAPYAIPFGPTAQAGLTSLSGLFNTTLVAAIKQAGLQVIPFDLYTLMNEVGATPSLYGFVNTTGVACTTTDVLKCNSSTLVAPNANLNYVFADGKHGTTGFYTLQAQAMTSMITGPQQIASLGDTPFRAEDANYRALDGRMWSGLDSQRPPRKLEAWVAYDYGSIDMQAGPNNGTGHGNTVAVGGDMKVSDRMLAGLMFGYTDTRGDFGGAGGGFTLKQPVLTGYAGYGEGPWYVGMTAGAGSLDYSDVNRNIQLGQAVRNESGQTRGYEYTGRVLGGYWFKYQDLLHGPYGRVTYTKAIVRQFSETGSSSTALTYGQQDNDQLVWSAGWQVAGKWGGIRPFARVTWEYDSLDNDRTVSASPVNNGIWYSLPAQKPDNSYALFNLGASADFGGVTGYLSGSGTAARGDGNYWAVTVGLRMPL
jgi:outer membrane lipase/esterase